ncbi:glycine/betaine/sarcosine/D-proline reductase family selenoprotein B [Lachnospiraceae bacterium PF1-21]
MSKRIVHYINQFFGGIGGEEKADVRPEMREGVVGPGASLAQALGEDYEIVATIICGDNYFGENIDEAVAEIMEMVKKYEPDVFVAGPAFNAGRYGVACGTIAKAVAEQLEIPVLTGMYEENPGADMFRKDMLVVATPNSAAGMRKVVPVFTTLIKKLANGEEILGPAEEGYLERGIRVNYFAEERASTRAIEQLLRKVKGEEYHTDYPMPVFDRVDPCGAVTDVSKIKIAIVTSGGIVPQGNPDHIESSSATRYGIYDITGMDTMSPEDFMTVHGGYDRQFVLQDPNLVIPLDVLREMEKEGRIGELANYFVTTTGTGTSTGNAKAFGEEFSKKLLADGVDAVILTST